MSELPWEQILSNIIRQKEPDFIEKVAKPVPEINNDRMENVRETLIGLGISETFAEWAVKQKGFCGWFREFMIDYYPGLAADKIDHNKFKLVFGHLYKQFQVNQAHFQAEKNREIRREWNPDGSYKIDLEK